MLAMNSAGSNNLARIFEQRVQVLLLCRGKFKRPGYCRGGVCRETTSVIRDFIFLEASSLATKTLTNIFSQNFQPSPRVLLPSQSFDAIVPIPRVQQNTATRLRTLLQLTTATRHRAGRTPI
jgi:hypothetical protein